MIRNARLGDVRVDPRNGLVTLDGTPVRSEPAQEVPLSRLYFL
jgi:urease subunit alpha